MSYRFKVQIKTTPPDLRERLRNAPASVPAAIARAQAILRRHVPEGVSLVDAAALAADPGVFDDRIVIVAEEVLDISEEDLERLDLDGRAGVFSQYAGLGLRSTWR